MGQALGLGAQIDTLTHTHGTFGNGPELTENESGIVHSSGIKRE